MSLTRDELLGIAHAERQRLGRMIQFADPETWERPSAADGWWNRDVFAHLASHDTAAAQLLAGEDPVELTAHREGLGDEPFSIDGWNAFGVNNRAGMDTREVLESWGAAAASFAAHAAVLDEDDWEKKRLPWLAGEIGPKYLVQSRVVEWWLHGEDVRATNGLGPHYQQWPVWLTIDLGIRMLPWALGQAGYDLSGRTLRVDVEGPGHGEWHWGLGPGELPAVDKRPDVTLHGRAPQLALVAGRRLRAADVLASGTVVPSGDRHLGELLLQVIRAYP